jgi:tRNA 5-methylaminomethyl-2-thiouridine biosynthesis bifunctional protein
MRPASLVAAQLGAAGAALTPHLGTSVHAIAQSGGLWQALAADGRRIAAAPVLLLANSNDAPRLAAVAQALQRIRGQISYVPCADFAAPRIVLTGSGYVLPEASGMVVTGSTYDRDCDDPEPQPQGHEANLLRLAHLLPQAQLAPDASKLRCGLSLRGAGPHAAHRRDAGRGRG